MRKFIINSIVVSIVIIAIVGLNYRQSYTDYTSNNEFMLGMSVPAWLDDINPEHMSSLRKLLPDSSIIIKIEATGEIIHEYYQNIQRVRS